MKTIQPAFYSIAIAKIQKFCSQAIDEAPNEIGVAPKEYGPNLAIRPI
jgi:hypothetical protein